MKKNRLSLLIPAMALLFAAVFTSCNNTSGTDDPKPIAPEVSPIAGTYVPCMTNGDKNLGAFSVEATWKDPNNIPKLDLSSLGLGSISINTVVLPLVNNILGTVYGHTLQEFTFNNDGSFNFLSRQLLNIDIKDGELVYEFSKESYLFFDPKDNPNAEFLQQGIRYYTSEDKLYVSISKAMLREMGEEDGMDICTLIDNELKKYPGLGIVSTDLIYGIPFKYEFDNAGLLTILIDKEMVMPLMPLLETGLARIPEKIDLENGAKLPARQLATTLVDGLFNQTSSLTLSVKMQRQ